MVFPSARTLHTRSVPDKGILIFWIGTERFFCRSKFMHYDFSIPADDLIRKQPDQSWHGHPVLKQTRLYIPFRYIFPDRQ